MLRFASPAVLVAGAMLALVPLVLHLIARRPAERSALPTARFLDPDPRTHIRMSRRPTDVPLMLLRMLFVLLVVAALARPSWAPAREGTVALVILDAGAGMAPVWDAALAEARTRLAAGGGLLAFDSSGRLAVGADAAVLLDSLAGAGPAARESDYAAGFRALPALAAALPAADSGVAVLITRPRFDAWGDGLAALRAVVWPGRITLVEPSGGGDVAGAANAAGPDGTSVLRAVVLGPAGRGVYVEAALGALGWTVDTDDEADAALYVVLGSASPEELAAAVAAARAGARLLVAGAAGLEPALAAVVPWTSGASGAADRGGTGVASHGDLLFDDGTRLRGAGSRLAGWPAAGTAVTAAWDDGRPAAAAATLGAGCVTYLATDPEAGRLPLDPEFPAALDRLTRPCEAVVPGGAAGRPAVRLSGPLDAGARAVLEGRGGANVQLASLATGRSERPLYRWFILAALGVALLEAMVVYRHGIGRERE